MENLSENMSDILRKCKLLEDYVNLHLRRESIIPNLRSLKSTAENTENSLNESNKILQDHKNALEKYKNLMTRMQNQQVKILKLINIIKKSKKDAITEMRSVKKPSQLSLITPVSQKMFKNLQKQNYVPTTYFSDFENSPFVPVRPTQLLRFFEFDVKITTEMFNEIPRYMRGRDTLDDLVNFLDILIPCFIEKYQLLSKKRDTIKYADIQIWHMYKEQASLLPNQKFITQGDLTRKLNRLIDKKIQAKITMLRHLNIISEQRKSSTICYIWTSN